MSVLIFSRTLLTWMLSWSFSLSFYSRKYFSFPPLSFFFFSFFKKERKKAWNTYALVASSVIQRKTYTELNCLNVFVHSSRVVGQMSVAFLCVMLPVLAIRSTHKNKGTEGTIFYRFASGSLVNRRRSLRDQIKGLSNLFHIMIY